MRLTEAEVIERVDQLTVRRLRLWVRKGWLAPATGEAGPVFDELDLARIRLVCELRADMNLNDETVPIVLSLIDQLHGLRRELRALAGAIEQQPRDIRQQLQRAYRRSLDR